MLPPPAPSPERLQGPVARLLRPLVRLFIRAGITFPAVSTLLRELYVNVAEHDFALPDKEQTDSRVSLLTGIHRKEVSRLRTAGAPVGAIPATLSRTSRIVARWLAEPHFTDAAGHARALPRTGENSFETLVTAETRDLRPRAVLDEWLASGLVTLDADGNVALAEAGFIPQGGSDQQLYYFGRNLHDHLAAAVANVLAAQPPFMERAVHYDGLTPEAVRHLEKRSRDAAMAMLQTINREAHAAAQAGPAGSCRFILGTYVYREDAEQEDAERRDAKREDAERAADPATGADLRPGPKS